MILFVYGTLKQGERNNKLMQGRFLREVRTEPKFRLVDFGTFPGLAFGRHAISGELWEVDDETLVKLDEFEGIGDGVYIRKLIQLEDGEQAYAYLCQPFFAVEYDGTNWHERERQTVSQSLLSNAGN